MYDICGCTYFVHCCSLQIHRIMCNCLELKILYIYMKIDERLFGKRRRGSRDEDEVCEYRQSIEYIVMKRLS